MCTGTPLSCAISSACRSRWRLVQTMAKAFSPSPKAPGRVVPRSGRRSFSALESSCEATLARTPKTAEKIEKKTPQN